MPLNAARAAGQGVQNTLIKTASVLTSIELKSVQIGGSSGSSASEAYNEAL